MGDRRVKKFQALKFEVEMERDLKYLASIKNVSYNGYVESVLSAHILGMKRMLREAKLSIETKGL